jgi:hypothetical protein
MQRLEEEGRTERERDRERPQEAQENTHKYMDRDRKGEREGECGRGIKTHAGDRDSKRMSSSPLWAEGGSLKAGWWKDSEFRV